MSTTRWSPGWQFDDDTFGQTAISFDNPDFVQVVIHAYRHAFGLAPGTRPPQEAPEEFADAVLTVRGWLS
jgi:hypothetical protein